MKRSAAANTEDPGLLPRMNLMWLKNRLSSTAVIAAELMPEWKHRLETKTGSVSQNSGAAMGIMPMLTDVDDDEVHVALVATRARVRCWRAATVPNSTRPAPPSTGCRHGCYRTRPRTAAVRAPRG